MPFKCNFFIVGAPKCGTTTLARYLADNPKVCFSNPKEVNYFSASDIKAQNLYYSDAIIQNLDEYHRAFQPGPEAEVYGEGSVSYLFYPGVPEKIYEYNSAAKIIVMLRDPVDRAFSHYLMDFRLGYVKNTFEEVFRNRQSFPAHFQQYFLLGLYGEQIERYIARFGQDNVLILKDSELRDSPELTLDKVFSFLGVGSDGVAVGARSHNEYKAARNKIVEQFYKSHFMRVLMRRLLSRNLQSRLKSLLFTQKDKPVLGAEFRAELQEFYRADMERLSGIVGSDYPKEWLNSA